MKTAFLKMANSNNSLDATKLTMHNAPVAFSNATVKLKVSIGKRKAALKLPELDLLGHATTPPKRTNGHPEGDALREVLKALRAHPAVSWCERQNTGCAKVDGRFIRFGWPGCPDVLGQLTDGRLLGVEVKSRTGRPSPEQTLFLARIRDAGGVGFVARDLRDVLRELGPL
ncbi:VRR-NUC domain-containing protein [Rhodoferax antarcticus]|uniref:VRR-NUC domain-containing protein n=1 Tax=Rhodoferax antarcticus TaxID=81479 RepID=UPI0022249D35|nr:VRR-NUC domain-containing protein [Rhodoferax antarcticus]MCW2310578.1 hypothetical protein [Rhodoferax antarcticus]